MFPSYQLVPHLYCSGWTLVYTYVLQKKTGEKVEFVCEGHCSSLARLAEGEEKLTSFKTGCTGHFFEGLISSNSTNKQLFQYMQKKELFYFFVIFSIFHNLEFLLLLKYWSSTSFNIHQTLAFGDSLRVCVCMCVPMCVFVCQCVNSEEVFVFIVLQDPSGEWIHNEASTRAETQQEAVSDTTFTFSASGAALSASLHCCLYSVSTGRWFGISISCSAL